jgi:hypothetical protein
MSYSHFVSLPKSPIAVGVLVAFVFAGIWHGTQAAYGPSLSRICEKEEQRIQSEVHDPNHFLHFDGLPDSEKTEVFSRLRNGAVITHPMTASEHQAPGKFPGGLVHHWMVIAFMHA